MCCKGLNIEWIQTKSILLTFIEERECLKQKKVSHFKARNLKYNFLENYFYIILIINCLFYYKLI